MAVKEKEGVSKMKLLNAWKLDNGQLGRHSQDMVNGIYRTTAQFQSNLLPAVAAPRDQVKPIVVVYVATGLVLFCRRITSLDQTTGHTRIMYRVTYWPTRKKLSYALHVLRCDSELY